MEVEFVIRADDILAFHEYAWAHPPKQTGNVSRGLWLVLALFGLLSLLEIPALVQGDWSWGNLFPPIMVVAVLIGKLFWRPLARRTVRRNLEQNADRNAKMLGWKRMAVTPEALIATSEHSTSMLSWAGIEKIVIADEYAFIFDSPTSAYVVPRRAFADEATFREFVERARLYRDREQEARADRPRRSRPAEDETGIKSDRRPDR